MNADTANRGVDESLGRDRLINLGLILAGLALVAAILWLTRGGAVWFTGSAWSKVSVGGWIAIAAITLIALVVQYYLLILLRHRFLKHLYWLLPAVWLLINGLLVIQRLIESEAGRALTGWLPLTDLVGWLLSATFLPLLAAGGAVAAIVDGAGISLAQTCRAASLDLGTLGVAEQGLFDYLDVYWDRLSDSFQRQVALEHATARPFLDFGAGGLFNLPHWFFNLGYYFGCITV